MATLRYTSWELQGEAGKILLKGQSVGNGQTIDFTETGIIAKDADGVYTLTIEGNKRCLHQSDQIATQPLAVTRNASRGPEKARGIFRSAVPQTVPGRNLAEPI